MKLKHLSSEWRSFFQENGFNINHNIEAAFNSKGQTPLMCAITLNRTIIAIELISAKANVEVADKEGRTPIMLAVMQGNFELVNLLVKRIPNLNNIRFLGSTLLMIAVADPVSNENKKSASKIVRLLIENGVKVDEVNPFDGYTALMYAAQNGHRRVVKTLIEQNANVNHRSNVGLTALTTAMGKTPGIDHHPKIIDLLLSHLQINIESADNNGNTPLLCASSDGHLDIVEKLLEMKANVHAEDKFNHNSLYLASFGGHLKVVKALVIKGKSNINGISSKLGSSAMAVALIKGHAKVAKFLMKRGASLEKAGEYPVLGPNFANILRSIVPGSTTVTPGDFATQLVDKLADLSKIESGNISTLDCASLGDSLFAKAFTPANQNANANNNASLASIVAKKLTLQLCRAASENKLDEIRSLIKSGAEINAMHSDGKTNNSANALHIACKYGQFEAAQLLIQLGADKNAKTNSGKIPANLVPLPLKDKFKNLFDNGILSVDLKSNEKILK